MDFQHGSRARFYYHSLDLSMYAEQVEQQLTRSLSEYRPLGATGVIRVQGHRDASVILSAGAFTDASDEWLWQRFTEEGARPWTLLPVGEGFENPVYIGQSMGQNQQRVVGDDVIRLPVSKVTTGTIYRGLVLHPLGPAGVSPGSESDCGVIGGTTDGGLGLIHVTRMVGTNPELHVWIEHAVDPILGPWDTIVDFLPVFITVGSMIVHIALPATIRQYVRVAWTLIGDPHPAPTPEADFFVAFVRH